MPPEWLTLPMGSCALTDALLALRVDPAAARGRWATARDPQCRTSLRMPEAMAAGCFASASQAASETRTRTTKLQWFVLNPLEELLMSQRARLVLDEGDGVEREAERARGQGLVQRVARV